MTRPTGPRSRNRRSAGVRVELLEARDVPSGFSLDGGTLQLTLPDVTITLIRVSEAASEETGVRFDRGADGHLYIEARFSAGVDNGSHGGDSSDGDWDGSDGGRDRDDEVRDDRGNWQNKDDKGNDSWDDDDDDNGHRNDDDISRPTNNTAPPNTGNPRPSNPVGVTAGPTDPARPDDVQTGNNSGQNGSNGNAIAPPRPRLEDASENAIGSVRGSGSGRQSEENGESSESTPTGNDAAPGTAPTDPEPGVTPPPDFTSAAREAQAAVVAQAAAVPLKYSTEVSDARAAEAAALSTLKAAGASGDERRIALTGSRGSAVQADTPQEQEGKLLPLLIEPDAAGQQLEPLPHAADVLQDAPSFDLGALDAAFGQLLSDLAAPETAEAWLSRLGPWLAVGAAGVGLASELARRHLRHTRRNLLRAAGPDGVSLTWFPELGSSLE